MMMLTCSAYAAASLRMMLTAVALLLAASEPGPSAAAVGNWTADVATLKTNLTENDCSGTDRRLTTLVHKIDAALTPRSDDPTGLYSDRVGLLGQGWVGVLEECGLTTAKAEHLVFALAKAIQGPKGVRTIWGGFTSKLQALSLEAGTGSGETPRHLSVEQEGLWIRIQGIREELGGTEDRQCEFGKLSVKGDVSIWRAWLDEYVAHREAGECKDESVDCAFRFAWNVSKARNHLRGKAGNAAKKLVRELGLKAFKKQHYEKIPYFRTILDEELVTKLVAAGWINNDGERQGGERAGVGLAERTARNGRREADAATGSGTGSVLVSAEAVQAGPVCRSRSVLGMGRRGGSGGDAQGAGAPSSGGTGSGSAGSFQGRGSVNRGGVERHRRRTGSPSLAGCGDFRGRDGQSGGDSAGDSGSDAAWVAGGEGELHGAGRIPPIQAGHRCAIAEGRVRRNTGQRPVSGDLVGESSRGREKERRCTSGSLRRFREQNQEARSRRVRQCGAGLRGWNAERASADRRAAAAVYSNRPQEVGLLGPFGGVGGECGVGLVEGEWRSGGSVAPDKEGGEEAVVARPWGATRHNPVNMALASVQDIYERRRQQSVARLRVQRSQEGAQTPLTRRRQYVRKDSEAGRRIDAALDEHGSFVVTCVPWFGLVSREPDGQLGEETIHGQVLRDPECGTQRPGLLLVRPYRKSTRIWTNARQWVPSGRSGNGRCPGKGMCPQMEGSRHKRSVAGGSRRVTGKGSVAGKSAVPRQLMLELVEAVQWRQGGLLQVVK